MFPNDEIANTLAKLYEIPEASNRLNNDILNPTTLIPCINPIYKNSNSNLQSDISHNEISYSSSSFSTPIRDGTESRQENHSVPYSKQISIEILDK